MATPTYAVNGGANLPGIIATWQPVVRRRNTDGSTEWQNYAGHTWEAALMTVANYLTLQALRGRRLTSLATNDIEERNEAATYTSAEIVNLAGQQQGHRMINVRVEFRVDVS